MPVGGKVGQQYRRRHVADDLTGNAGGQSCVLRHYRRQRLPYGSTGSHIACKKEEAEEGGQQAVVHLAEQRPVKDQHTRRHHGQQGRIGQHPEHRQQAQHKQSCHQSQPSRTANGGLFRKGDPDPLRLDTQGRNDQPHQANQGEGHHGGKELTGGQLIVGIDIQILRVAYRSSHAAQIGGNGLEHHNINQPLRSANQSKHQHRKGHKCNEGHIVGHQHGHKEGQQHQCQGHKPHSPFAGQQPLSQHREHAALLQASHHRHQTEQQAQHPPVNIIEIVRRRRIE